MTAITPDERRARDLDDADPLSARRAEFLIPPYDGPGGEAAYFAGNSLGLQPAGLKDRLGELLDDWAGLGVEGHLEAKKPWYSYHELLRGPTARLVGALPEEVVVMNSLTVNLHLLMVSFYRPTPERHAILIEDSAFPSDSYAVRSQAAFHGYDPDEAVIRVKPRPGETTLRTEDIIAKIADNSNRSGGEGGGEGGGGRAPGHTDNSNRSRGAGRVALVLLGAVNYYTGEFLDIGAITRAAREHGVAIGWDLAHAAGNVPLTLHDTGPDFAAWCSYKYLNSGPGSLSGVFVHERHLSDHALPRFAGWWSTDAATRFEMQPGVRYKNGVDSWQISNPPILSMAAVLYSLEMFDQTGMTALRAKSVRLTRYLESLLDEGCAARPGVSVITPRDPARRGAQLSVRIADHDVGPLTDTLRREFGVYADARRPDVIRLAPAPLYNTFHDCWRAATALTEVLT